MRCLKRGSLSRPLASDVVLICSCQIYLSRITHPKVCCAAIRPGQKKGGKFQLGENCLHKTSTVWNIFVQARTWYTRHSGDIAFPFLFFFFLCWTPQERHSHQQPPVYITHTHVQTVRRVCKQQTPSLKGFARSLYNRTDIKIHAGSINPKFSFNGFLSCQKGSSLIFLQCPYRNWLWRVWQTTENGMKNEISRVSG